MTQFTVSRRAVLGGATSALLVPAAAHAATPARHYDEMTDVLIVGSGFAGMAAALAAAEKGVKVKVIEKMAFLGGNSSLSGGMMAVPGSSVQKAQGIEDSPEKLIADMTRIGQGLGNPELRKLFKSTLNNRLHRNLACVIDKSSRGAKLKRAFEELP